MKRLVALAAFALVACGDEGPHFGAVICLEDHNQRHVFEADLSELLARHGLEDTNLGVDVGASKFWGPTVSVRYPGTWVPEQPILIFGNLLANGDDQLLADFEALFVEDWGGFRVQNTGVQGDICGGADTGVQYRMLQG
ncbi:MAG: hypothetical protein ACX930_14615 [Erythrobacter sp.]